MASMIRSSDRMGPDRVMCCSRTEMTVGLGRITEAFQATHRSRGATVGVAGSIARTSHRRTDNQPSKENASLPLKTWIYAENTELGIDLFPPCRCDMAYWFFQVSGRTVANRPVVRDRLRS